MSGQSDKKYSLGQSLVEVILAMAIFALIAATMVSFVIGGFHASLRAGEQTIAEAIVQEGMEAVLAIRYRDWGELVYIQSGVTVSDQQWVFIGEGTSDTIADYTREITFYPVFRDEDYNIVSETAPGAQLDPDSKDVHVVVTWNPRPGVVNTVERRMYLAYWEGEEIFLACDWSSLQSVAGASYDYPGNRDALKVALSNGYAFVVISHTGSQDYDFAIHNVSYPTNSTLAASLDFATRSNRSLTNIAVADDYAYLTAEDDDNELYILNISDPRNPSLESTLDLAGDENANGIYVVEERVYISRDGSRRGDELYIVDASDPANPDVLGSADIGDNREGGNEIFVSGDYAYIASPDSSRNLKIVDVSDPENPVYLETSGYEASQSNNQNALTIAGFEEDDVVVLGSNDGYVYFLDISDPTSIDQTSEISNYDIGDIVYDLSVADYLGEPNSALLVVTDDNINGEFQVIDIQDVALPIFLSGYQFDASLLGVCFDGDFCRAYVVGSSNRAAEFYVVVPGDGRGPSTITDLSCSNPTDQSVDLSWTAPGDDGSQGTASAYDLRYDTSPITELTWMQAAQVTEETAPAIAGTLEFHQVAGLQAETTYYFAIKAADEAGNESDLSNIPSIATLESQDTAPPQTILDLTLSNPTANTMTLSWTAPGDDGVSGTATAYDVRYSTALITEANWAAAVQVTGEPVPGGSGFSESMVVDGLGPETTYYFAIKAVDEVPNFSSLSNVPSATTQTAITTCAQFCQSQGYLDGVCRQNAQQCNSRGEVHQAGGDLYCPGGPSADTCCCVP